MAWPGSQHKSTRRGIVFPQALPREPRNVAPVDPPPATPRRDVVEAEALAWLDANPAPAASSVITSLPDVSELALGFDAWRAWFLAAAQRVIRWVPDDGVAIFFQSDVRHRGVWVDKGYLVMRAAEDAGASLVWHKIACRKPAGTYSNGRATYAHLLCVSRMPRPTTQMSPDVLPDAGRMPWSKAMGMNACRLACRYLREETDTRVVVDPFCGHGTALAVANAQGLDALGVDVSRRQCKAARRLVVTEGERD